MVSCLAGIDFIRRLPFSEASGFIEEVMAMRGSEASIAHARNAPGLDSTATFKAGSVTSGGFPEEVMVLVHKLK